MTPRLTEHARQRCREMDVRTKRVKAVVREPAMTYPGNHRGETIAVGDGLAIAYVEDDDGQPHVLTVMYHGIEFVRPEHREATT